jgi:uncharacterized protein (DUF169 family)
MELNEIRSMGISLRHDLGLASFPVGVSFLRQKESSEGEVLENHRYCQALMVARRGKTVLLDGQGISCPAAARAFGFSNLPEKLASGEGLVGFGIVGCSETGKKMFENMPHFDRRALYAVELAPLEKVARIPDVVVVEDEVERLMWIALADLNIRGGERVASSTAVLQATCVDSTILPYFEKRLNLSFGCYGCRDATDILPGESVLGFPTEMLPGIVGEVQRLSRKAMPASRGKNAYAQLRKMEERSI